MRELLIIEPHYLGSLEFYVLLMRYKKVVFEVDAHFTKQTYKNRSYFLTSYGLVPLTIPVKYGNRTPLKDVRIDHTQSWLRDHWGAFYSAYGKAPFFEFFQSEFHSVWNRRHKFLIDLSLEMMTLCLRSIQYDMSFSLTSEYKKEVKKNINDLREHIHLKKPFYERKIYLPFPYMQTFGNKFVPNPSIVDLLMCEGNRAAEVLRQSSFSADEQI